MVKLDLLSIDALKSTLTAFNPSIDPQKPFDSLQAYLDFYSLPIPSEQISLCTGNISVNQKSVFVCAWQPPKPRGTALVVHGYLDHLGLYRHLINHLIDKNLAVVCFDLPGHGLSDGQAAFIEDFADYTAVLEALIDLCQQYYPAPFHGFGQSTGGAILLKHLLAEQHSKDYPLASLNLFAPLLHPTAWWLNRRLLPLIKPFRKSFVRHFGHSSQDREFVDFLCHKDLLQATSIPIPWLLAADKWAREFERCEGNDFPVNIIQGDADKTLNWKYNMRTFKQKLPNMNLQMIKSANHHMVNECQSLRTEIFNCIKL